MSARFKFRLEGFLKLRHSLEEEAQRHLARMIALQEEARGKVGELHASHTSTLEGRRMLPNQVVDLQRWSDTERYLLVLERRIVWATEELNTAMGQVTDARAALLRTHQDHLMLQRLKERRQEQHTLASQRQEAQEMDEIAVLRHRLKRATAPAATTTE